MEKEGKGTRPVKGMIRNRETEQYYKGENQWTCVASEAMQFDSISSAVAVAEKLAAGDCLEFVVEVSGRLGFSVKLGH